MFPLDQDLLMLLKFFILFTCIFFWLRLGYKAIMRHHRLDSYYRRRHDEED